MRRRELAVEPVPFGAPVRAVPGGCAVAEDLAEMIGVARRAGLGGAGYPVGAEVEIETDGGVAARIVRDCEVIVRDVPVRLLASEPHYLHLRGGRIAGFLGDRGLS